MSSCENDATARTVLCCLSQTCSPLSPGNGTSSTPRFTTSPAMSAMKNAEAYTNRKMWRNRNERK